MAFMEYRRLQAAQTLLADSGTWQLRLPKQGYVHALDVYMNITNGATVNRTETAYDAIDRVEIIANGNRVLYSLTGNQARVWSHAFLKKRPEWVHDQTPSVAQRAHIVIPFALGEWDTDHFLDLSQFSEVELRITYSPTIAATAFATGTVVCTVYAQMWHTIPAGARSGFLRITEQYYFTTLASGDTVYDLPSGNPVAALGLYVYEAGVDPHANVDAFELELDNGTWSPIIGLFEDLAAKFAAMCNIDTEQWGTAYLSNTDALETFAGTLEALSLDRHQTLTIGTTDTAEDYVSGYAGGQATLQTTTRDAASATADVANTTDGAVHYKANGKYGIGNFLFMPFSLLLPGHDSLDTSNVGRVRAIMTNGNAGAEARLALAEIVTR